MRMSRIEDTPLLEMSKYFSPTSRYLNSRELLILANMYFSFGMCQVWTVPMWYLQTDCVLCSIFVRLYVVDEVWVGGYWER